MIASHSPYHSAFMASPTPAANRTVGGLVVVEKSAVLESQTIPAVGAPEATFRTREAISGRSDQLERQSTPPLAKSPSGLPDAELSKRDSARSSLRDEAQTNKEAEAKARIERAELANMQREIASLAARDREVKAHEQAHVAVGGQYAGAAQYQYERGPDGVAYAVAGEVPIDVGKEANPQATIEKARTVRRAALAPAEPSPQDRRVAAQATLMEQQAQQELNELRRSEQAEQKEARQALAEDGAEEVETSAEETSAAATSNDDIPKGIETPRNLVSEYGPTTISSLSSGSGTPPSFVQQRQVIQLSQVQSLASPPPNNVLDELV